jgi:membrane associated rhomboid family serine protease
VSWFTAMFMHASWSHILGNMLFLAIFGKNVEDAFGHIRYLGIYIGGGFVAAMTQALMTLIGGSAADAAAPMLGASGAIAAVLGAYFVLYPDSRVLTLVIVFLCGSTRGSSSACGSSTSSLRPISASSQPAPTVAGRRSSRTSVGSCSG